MSNTRNRFIQIFNNPDYESLTETGDYSLVIEDFLIRDNINVDQFQVNADYLRLGPVGMSLYSGAFEPSNSVLRFGFITSRPLIYPDWFLAAYPDVADSLTSKFKDNIQLLYSITSTTERYFENHANFDNGKFRPNILRALLNYYLRNPKGGLECAKVPSKNQTVSGSIMGDSMIPKDLQVEMLNQEAQNQFLSNNFEAALEKLNQSLKIASKARTYYLRGEVYFKTSNFSKAYEDFTAAINLDSKFAVAYLGRAVIRYRIYQKKNDAYNDLKIAAELGSEDAKTLLRQLF